MDGQNSTARCASFLRSQLQDFGHAEDKIRLGVTISRQSHTRGHTIAEELARHLEREASFCSGDWCVFDRNLVKQVLEDHDLPGRLEKFMPEDAISEVNQLMGEILGLHPPMWELFQNTCETIYRLAHVGNVVIMGRGANIITANLPGIIHVRLIGTEAQRVRQLQSEQSISTPDALRHLREEDRARARYLKTYFNRNIDDVSLYDLVINTDALSDASVVSIIACALEDCARQMRERAHPMHR